MSGKRVRPGESPEARKGVFDIFGRFLRLESSSGILLLVALAMALAWANSPWSEAYFRILERPLGFAAGGLSFTRTLQHWINDGLMTLFFFVVGLEIKRELVAGELAGVKRAAFPLLAALGGMMVPALIYAAFNPAGPAARGWGIPMATDIPFALGVLALSGNRIPNSLKVFLTALAIIDDLGSVLVIAVFYTHEISWTALGYAAAVFAVLLLLGRSGLRRPMVYLFLGTLLWCFLSRSGVHGTIAGVLVAWTVPCKSADSPLSRMEEALHPWTSYGILPLFALANAGVAIDPGLLASLWDPVGMGIFLGLAVGKPLGIFAVCQAALALGFPPLAGGVRWTHLLGAGMLGGIGFTMSIFISGLAFGGDGRLAAAKISVFLASLVSGILGWAWLRMVSVRPGPD